MYGHVIQESHLPLGPPEEPNQAAASAMAQEALRDFPHLVAMYAHARTIEHSLDDRFAFGLELVLDGLERLRSR